MCATPDMVDPGGVSGVLVDAVGLSINFEDALGVFWDLGGIWGATPDLLNVLLADPRGISSVLVDAMGLSIDFELISIDM